MENSQSSPNYRYAKQSSKCLPSKCICTLLVGRKYDRVINLLRFAYPELKDKITHCRPQNLPPKDSRPMPSLWHLCFSFLERCQSVNGESDKCALIFSEKDVSVYLPFIQYPSTLFISGNVEIKDEASTSKGLIELKMMKVSTLFTFFIKCNIVLGLTKVCSLNRPINIQMLCFLTYCFEFDQHESPPFIPLMIFRYEIFRKLCLHSPFSCDSPLQFNSGLVDVFIADVCLLLKRPYCKLGLENVIKDSLCAIDRQGKAYECSKAGLIQLTQDLLAVVTVYIQMPITDFHYTHNLLSSSCIVFDLNDWKLYKELLLHDKVNAGCEVPCYHNLLMKIVFCKSHSDKEFVECVNIVFEKFLFPFDNEINQLAACIAMYKGLTYLILLIIKHWKRNPELYHDTFHGIELIEEPRNFPPGFLSREDRPKTSFLFNLSFIPFINGSIHSARYYYPTCFIFDKFPSFLVNGSNIPRNLLELDQFAVSVKQYIDFTVHSAIGVLLDADVGVDTQSLQTLLAECRHSRHFLPLMEDMAGNLELNMFSIGSASLQRLCARKLFDEALRKSNCFSIFTPSAVGCTIDFFPISVNCSHPLYEIFKASCGELKKPCHRATDSTDHCDRCCGIILSLTRILCDLMCQALELPLTMAHYFVFEALKYKVIISSIHMFPNVINPDDFHNDREFLRNSENRRRSRYGRTVVEYPSSSSSESEISSADEESISSEEGSESYEESDEDSENATPSISSSSGETSSTEGSASNHESEGSYEELSSDEDSD